MNYDCSKQSVCRHSRRTVPSANVSCDEAKVRRERSIAFREAIAAELPRLSEERSANSERLGTAPRAIYASNVLPLKRGMLLIFVA